MKIVIDTNRIIAAMIKDGVSRSILFSKNFEFVTPDFSLDEISKHKDEIIKKANIDNEEFALLLAILFERINIISQEEYSKHMNEAEALISDSGDVPFIALALQLKADGIWSDDSDFLEQNTIKVYSTGEMMKMDE
jgi:predicted nucleic acid-binding protein